MNPFQRLKIIEKQKWLMNQLILFLNPGPDKPASKTSSRAALYQKEFNR
jgi:hypothetical protein